MTTPLPDRLLCQLELALLRDCGCTKTLARLEETAREQGLTGAEIDAALSGRSFEARGSVMLAFACALKEGRADLAANVRARSQALGMSEADLDSVAEYARRLLAPGS